MKDTLSMYIYIDNQLKFLFNLPLHIYMELIKIDQLKCYNKPVSVLSYPIYTWAPALTPEHTPISVPVMQWSVIFPGQSNISFSHNLSTAVIIKLWLTSLQSSSDRLWHHISETGLLGWEATCWFVQRPKSKGLAKDFKQVLEIFWDGDA